MNKLSKLALFWAPRALSMAFIAFLSLFALDVFNEGYGFWKTLLALIVHLGPVLVLVAVLLLAWRWEWVGAVLYAAAGTLYVMRVLSLRLRPAIKLNWILTIAGPTFVIAALFLANWLKRGQLRARP
ncbi:MAG: hypothetical protein ABSB82_16905 [Terriglobia bacterium]|jgi:hypothetical protein